MTGDEREAKRFEVYGVVQGVGFRHFVRTAAWDLGLDGWVRNRMDGSVEVVAAGERESLAELARRLRAGPPAAQVDRVDEGSAKVPSRGFSVRFD